MMSIDPVRARAYLRATAGALAVLLVGAVLVSLWFILHLAAQIDSCVNPEGECARRSQEQTGKAIQQIVDAVTAHPNPALRSAVLELCDAHGLDCAELRAPTEGN
jgi:hypothetical protein